jgi:hypothetical protein
MGEAGWWHAAAAVAVEDVPPEPTVTPKVGPDRTAGN